MSHILADFFSRVSGPWLIFSTAFLLTALLAPAMIWLGPKVGLADSPGGRRQHQGVVSRLGGVALFGGFMGACWLILRFDQTTATAHDYQLLRGVLVGTGFIFLFGLADDLFEFSTGPQYLAQLSVALIGIYFTIFIEFVTFPFLDTQQLPRWIVYPFTVFWVMGMINTVNWLDGLDGLAAGVTAIAALLFAWHAYKLGQEKVYLFPLALAGACAGFLLFNFSPAKIFMGSGGSFTLGWALASLSILAPAKVATALLVLGIPILDVVWLIIWRWRTQGSPQQAGRDHLHFRLLDLGFSTRTIVLGYYLFCLAFGLLALLLPSPIYKLVAILILGGGMMYLLWQVSKPERYKA